MQGKENSELRKRGKPGFVDKRFYVPTEIDSKVDFYKKKMEIKTGQTLRWEDAAIELLSKATQKIKVTV